jgi:hypothetical protein
MTLWGLSRNTNRFPESLGFLSGSYENYQKTLKKYGEFYFFSYTMDDVLVTVHY